MSRKLASITGVQGYVPDYVLTNAELETMVETNDEWIRTRTGIHERRILKGDNMGASYMGEQMVRGLLEKTNTDPSDIEVIICARGKESLEAAKSEIARLHASGAVPILVGGTGLYIRTLLEGIAPIPDIDRPPLANHKRNASRHSADRPRCVPRRRARPHVG